MVDIVKLNKIKIAIFKPLNANRHSAFFTGQHNVFKYLQEKFGYEVTYFIENYKNDFNGVKVKNLQRDNFMTISLRTARLFFGEYKYFWKIPYYKNLDFSPYDIIITEGIHYIFLDYFKNSISKVILNDSISNDFSLPNGKVKFLNKYFGYSTAVIVNEKISDLYRKNRLSINTICIGHAISVAKIPFIERTSCTGRMISVGRLVPEKGFEYIIKAISVLKNKHPGIRLDIYGEGPLKNSLIDLINSSGLEKLVCLKGTLPNLELIRSLEGYDLFISHPLETQQIAEAFSMSNMEAMAAGIPVITSRCGGIPYVVKDRAILVDQKMVDQIVSAVANFLDNPSVVGEYSAIGRKYVEDNFSIDVIAKKWDKVIKDILNNKNGRI